MTRGNCECHSRILHTVMDTASICYGHYAYFIQVVYKLALNYSVISIVNSSHKGVPVSK